MTITDRPPEIENWRVLNKKISKLSEKKCVELLSFERAAGNPRLMIMLRLYGRINKLRTQRERHELMQEATQ
jgi:hypothetical protein